MKTPRGRAAMGGMAVAVVAMGVLAALGIASAWFGEESPAARPQVFPAEDDAEWLAVIEEAKRAQDATDPFPEPLIPDGVTLIRSCSDIPEGASISDTAFQYDASGTRKRVLINYFVPPDTRVALLVDENTDFTGCPPGLSDSVSAQDPRMAAVNAHICAEMARMADGLPATDPTLRPASVQVARAYVDALCKSSYPGAASDSWPEPRIQEGVTVVYSCEELPEGAIRSDDSAIEYHPDGDRWRVLQPFSVPPSDRYMMIIYFPRLEPLPCLEQHPPDSEWE